MAQPERVATPASTELDRFAADRTRRASSAEIGTFETAEDLSAGRSLVAIGNDWTRRHFGGDFHMCQLPESLPAVSLVFVQSREGNTAAEDPATLGGGDTDLHLIYEGLSRVAADAVLAGSTTARGGVFFSVWHPELVSLREHLDLPRHPVQIVVSADGNIDFDGTLLFNVPDLAVMIIAGDVCRERCEPMIARRPWITVVPMHHNDLTRSLRELRHLGIRRISAVGGRTIASALIDAGVVQDLYLTTTSRSAGEPNSPFYTGAKKLRLDPVLQKKLTGVSEDAVIRFEHFGMVAPPRFLM